MRWIFIGILIFSMAAHSEESLGMKYIHMDWEWSRPTLGELAFFAPSQILLLIDMLQTLDIARRPNEYSETNFFMGKHPSVEHVWIVGLSTMSASTLYWFILPPKVRWLVPVIISTIEVAAIAHNLTIGLKIRF